MDWHRVGQFLCRGVRECKDCNDLSGLAQNCWCVVL
jgi:hypothetical protein